MFQCNDSEHWIVNILCCVYSLYWFYRFFFVCVIVCLRCSRSRAVCSRRDMAGKDLAGSIKTSPLLWDTHTLTLHLHTVPKHLQANDLFRSTYWQKALGKTWTIKMLIFSKGLPERDCWNRSTANNGCHWHSIWPNALSYSVLGNIDD